MEISDLLHSWDTMVFIGSLSRDETETFSHLGVHMDFAAASWRLGTWKLYLYVGLSDLAIQTISFLSFRDTQSVLPFASQESCSYATQGVLKHSPNPGLILCWFLLLRCPFAAFGIDITRLGIDSSWHTIICMVEMSGSPMAQFWLLSTANIPEYVQT